MARREGGILEIDRFSDRVIREIEIPGPAAALRPAGYGQWLLVHPAASDSVWVIDLSIGRYLSDWSTQWSGDLPAVAEARFCCSSRATMSSPTIIAATGWPETGRVRGGGSDLWLPIAWTPEARDPSHPGRYPATRGQRNRFRCPGLSPGQQLPKPRLGRRPRPATSRSGADGLGAQAPARGRWLSRCARPVRLPGNRRSRGQEARQTILYLSTRIPVTRPTR